MVTVTAPGSVVPGRLRTADDGILCFGAAMAYGWELWPRLCDLLGAVRLAVSFRAVAAILRCRSEAQRWEAGCSGGSERACGRSDGV